MKDCQLKSSRHWNDAVLISRFPLHPLACTPRVLPQATFRERASMTVDAEILDKIAAAAKAHTKAGCERSVITLSGYWQSWK